MTCSSCKTQFCWLCTTKLRQHSEPHTCHRYDPSCSATDDEERRAIFAAERYKGHEDAGFFASEQAKYFDKKSERLLEMFSGFLRHDDMYILGKALSTLVDARNFLKYSYMAILGMKSSSSSLTDDYDNNDNYQDHDTQRNNKRRRLLQLQRHDIFESYQGTLEMFTERLNQLIETSLHPLYVEKGELGIRSHFRALDFYELSVTCYMKRILSLIDTTNNNKKI